MRCNNALGEVVPMPTLPVELIVNVFIFVVPVNEDASDPWVKTAKRSAPREETHVETVIFFAA